jgi:hypothetical protein
MSEERIRRDIDALVAEHVMGASRDNPRPYTSDVALAWEVTHHVMKDARNGYRMARLLAKSVTPRMRLGGVEGEPLDELIWEVPVFAILRYATPLDLCRAALITTGEYDASEVDALIASPPAAD